ncbi:MAG TPA: contractile injection system tape measure protein [Chitinophagaceae bacterium]
MKVKMIVNMMHLVNKLIINAACSDESTAFDARHRFSQHCQQRIPAMIDELCSKYANENEWIQIDRLELDLGEISSSGIEQALKEYLYRILDKEINNKMQSISIDRIINSKRYSWFELLIYFLENGRFPWWAEGTALNADDICRDVLKEQKNEIKEFLFKNRSNERIWKRISMQFPGEQGQPFIDLFEELKMAQKKILNYRTQQNAENAGELYLRPNTIQQFVLLKAPLFLGNDTTDINKISKQLQQELSKEYKLSKETAPMKKENREAIKRMLVKHAGIVLLSPFFKSFFDKLKLLQDNEWRSEQARHTAIHLLHYLATGDQQAPEHDLGLEKILCGADQAEPISRDVLLSENEIHEAKELLLSVIDHWTALKNTSMAGLRVAFFNREGIIEKKDDGWIIRVERKTEDVLMESIPWGYSTIILPWNNYFIYVEW